MEHPWAAAKDRLGEDSTQVEAWVEARKQELWEGGVEAVLTALKDGEAASEIHYFETNRHRIRYAEFRAGGLSHRQRHGGERLQAGNRGTAQTGRNALDQGRRSSSAELASPVAQWPLGRNLARHPPPTYIRLNLGAHPFERLRSHLEPEPNLGATQGGRWGLA